MDEPPPGSTPEVIHPVETGDTAAAEQLLSRVYSELRKLARCLVARMPAGNTLQPTALVHEAYLRLVRNEDPGWKSRVHFFAAAARAMRRILVERARRTGRRKHGGGRPRLDADAIDIPVEAPVEDTIAVHEALERLRRHDRRQCDVVMLRYFAGLTIEGTAAALGVSEPTVERDWRSARELLHKQLV